MYQRTLHHTIHGPDEPLPVNLATKLKSTAVNPLQKEPATQLPSLPHVLLKEQKSLVEQRAVTSKSGTIPHHPPSSSPASSTSLYRHQSGRSKLMGGSASLIRKHSSELLLNSDPETVMTRYFPPLESLTDPLDIADRLRREPELGFLYLTPVEERHSVNYNPYNLK